MGIAADRQTSADSSSKMGGSSSAEVDSTTKVEGVNPVPEGKVRICCSGFKISHHTGRARQIIDTLVTKYPDKFESWFYFSGEHIDFVEALKPKFTEEKRAKFSSRKGWSSPFVWLEMPDGSLDALGGRDDLCEWMTSESGPNPPPGDNDLNQLTSDPGLCEAFGFNKDLGTAQVNAADS